MCYEREICLKIGKRNKGPRSQNSSSLPLICVEISERGCTEFTHKKWRLTIIESDD